MKLVYIELGNQKYVRIILFKLKSKIIQLDDVYDRQIRTFP